MLDHSIQLSGEQMERLFPFHFQIDNKLRITEFGRSLKKLYSVEQNAFFTNHFRLFRPAIENPSYPDLQSLRNKMIMLKSHENPSIVIRGQFEEMTGTGNLLFIGTPWFDSMEQVREHQLTIHDFAPHDPLIDLLHVSKTQELVTEDLKQLLGKVQKQKEELKKATQEIHDIALFSQQSPNPLFRIDLEGNLLALNPVASSIHFFRYKDVEYAAADFWRFVAKKMLHDSKSISLEVMAQEKLYLLNLKYLAEEQYYNVYGQDITHAKKQEEKVRLLSLIAEDNLNAVVICDAQGKIEWVNKSYLTVTGYDFQELMGVKPGDILQGPETDIETINYLRSQIRKGDPFKCEILNYAKSGRKYWVRIQGQSWKNEEGAIVGYFAVQEEITQAKEVEDRIRESESRFSALIKSMNGGILLVDQQMNVVLVNQRYCEMFNIQQHADSLIGMDFVSLTEKNIQLFKQPADYRNMIEAALQSQHKLLEVELELANGQYYQLDYIPVIIANENKGHLWKFVDISKSKNIERGLKVQEEKYRNIIANMNIGILEVDNADRITYANQSFCAMSGYHIDELLVSNASNLFVHEDDMTMIAEKRKLRESGIADYYEIKVLNKKGETRWWVISGAPNFDDAGNLIGSISIHFDISNQKMLEEELMKAKEKAEESSKAKEVFLATMSHEIRTPLNAIIGIIRELNRGEVSGMQTQYLSNADIAAKHLMSLINNILDISKIEAGEFYIEERHFYLKRLVNEIVKIMSSLAAEKMLDLQVDICDSLPEVILGDPTRIRQILINILSNSVKFTDRGVIKIQCRQKVEGVEKKIVFTISDTGKGMETVFLKKLFNKFTQEERDIARKHGGTGLGMAITYELVNMMHGQIFVESQKDIGTTTEICLPLLVGDAQKIDFDTASGQIEILKNIRVLLVEDNEMNRLVAGSTLKNFHIQYDQAQNGEEALEMLALGKYDLVLMDIQMPVMNGLLATVKIRNEMGLKVPIVALSANAFTSEIDHYLSLGMNDYIIKPFEEDTFIRVVFRNLFPLHAKPTELIGVFDPSVSKTDLYDLTKLALTARGNQAFVHEMIQVFIKQVELAMHEMRNAVIAGDVALLNKVAHRIKPSLYTLGIRQVYQEIRILEGLSEMDTAEQDTEMVLDHLCAELKKVIQSLSQALPN